MARRRKARELTTSATKTAAFSRHVQDSLLISIADKGRAPDGGGIATTATTLCLAEDEKKTAALTTGVPGKPGREVVRRNKMKELFTALQSYVPHLPPKIAKAELAEETVNYIKFLEKECQALESRKQARTKCTHRNQKSPSGATSSAISPEHCISRETFLADHLNKTPFQTRIAKSAQNQCFVMHTSASPNVVLSIAGLDAHVSVCAPKTPGLIPATVQFLEKHGAEVLSLQICSDVSRTMFVMHAHVSELDGSMPAEERFKLAKKELILWLAASSKTSIPGNS